MTDRSQTFNPILTAWLGSLRRPRAMHVLSVFVLLVALSSISQTAHSCSVPVFRYALERWAPDIYDLSVIHRGPLDAGQQARVEALKKSSAEHVPYANFRVETIDLSQQEGGELAAVWEATPGKELPWAVLHYPRTTGLNAAAWSGPLSHPAVECIADSPLRQEVAERVLAGQSAVWVMLETGDRAADDAAAADLQSHLDALSASLELPELDEADIVDSFDETAVQETLKVAFSMVRLSKSDPAEAVFRRMLLHSEPDLATEYADKRMVFPIYGQGRALYALVGAGITEGNIREACEFMIGPCSCQVKDQNPGTDLLMVVDWDSLVTDRVIADVEMPPLVGLPSLPDVEPGGEVAAATPVAAISTSGEVISVSGFTGDAGPNLLLRNLLVTLVALGIVLAGAVVYAKMRTRTVKYK